MDEQLMVSSIGSTSASRMEVVPYDTIDAQRVVKYNNSGCERSLSTFASGLNDCLLIEFRHGHADSRGLDSRILPNRVR